jgi:riboflavin biosynthesis pyrimidine reductase
MPHSQRKDRPAFHAATTRAFAAYERRQRALDYSPAHVGRVRTLLDRAPRAPCHPRIESVWDGPLAFPPPPDPRLPYVVLAYVCPLDGKASVDDPGLIGGGTTDWWLYSQALRFLADAVAAGRETMCAPPRRLLSFYDPDLVRARSEEPARHRHPLQVVVSGSGELDPDRDFFLAVPDVPAAVITSRPAKARLARRLAGRANKHLIAAGRDPRRLDLRGALCVLRAGLGVGRLVLVGGTALATAFLQAGLVHELFLTRAPRLLGGRRRQTFFEGEGFPPRSAPAARLMSLKVGAPPWQDVLFQRWALSPT